MMSDDTITTIDTLEIIDEVPNLSVVEEFPLDINDIPKALQRVSQELIEDDNFNARKCILILVDDQNKIGVWGFGQINDVHSSIGILEQAKASILLPKEFHIHKE